MWIYPLWVIFTTPDITGDYLGEVFFGFQIATTAAIAFMTVGVLATYSQIVFLFNKFITTYTVTGFDWLVVFTLGGITWGLQIFINFFASNITHSSVI